MNNKEFDLWADGYDKTVGISDEENIYPFAGYKKVLGLIFQSIMGNILSSSPDRCKKIAFLFELRNYLKENGKIIIEDVAFETRKDLEKCKLSVGNAWDDNEIYFVVEELRKDLPHLSFTQISDCAGVLILD